LKKENNAMIASNDKGPVDVRICRQTLPEVP
jgi:hypothetical protein